MQAAAERPAYVVFEVRAEEDRAASLAAGHYVAKDVVYAIVTPQGSKDRHEKQVDDWLKNLEDQVNQERFPREWLQAYKTKYAAWVEGREIPDTGTPVSQWPVASPAQVKALLDAGLRTVEDLAAGNEEAISRLGMGGRALKQRAVEWLAAASNVGKVSEEMAALKARNADLEEANKTLNTRLEELASKVEKLSAKAG